MINTMPNNNTLNAVELESSKRLARIWHAKKKELGLSQERAAEIYGCSQANISQYLNAKIPLNTDAIFKFSKMLQVKPTEIRPDIQGQIEIEIADLEDITAKTLLPFLDKLSPVEAAKFLGMVEAVVQTKLKQNTTK